MGLNKLLETHTLRCYGHGFLEEDQVEIKILKSSGEQIELYRCGKCDGPLILESK